MSFGVREDILFLFEELRVYLFDIQLNTPFLRISYEEAIQVQINLIYAL